MHSRLGLQIRRPYILYSRFEATFHLLHSRSDTLHVKSDHLHLRPIYLHSHPIPLPPHPIRGAGSHVTYHGKSRWGSHFVQRTSVVHSCSLFLDRLAFDFFEFFAEEDEATGDGDRGPEFTNCASVSSTVFQ